MPEQAGRDFMKLFLNVKKAQLFFSICLFQIYSATFIREVVKKERIFYGQADRMGRGGDGAKLTLKKVLLLSLFLLNF